MDNDRIIELISSQGTKLDALSSNLAKLGERMTKLEALREQDIKQNEKIEQILTRLEDGAKHFEKIDSRLIALETAAGKNAKELFTPDCKHIYCNRYRRNHRQCCKHRGVFK